MLTAGGCHAFCSFMALAVLLAPDGRAGAPLPRLELLTSATAVGGVIYFRPGELILSQPGDQPAPALRPLVSAEVSPLPGDLEAFEEISSECGGAISRAEEGRDAPAGESRILARGDMEGDGVIEQVSVSLGGPARPPSVQVLRKGEAVAEAHLPHSAVPCMALIAEPREGDAPALLMVWASAGVEGTTVGVSVYQLPSAQEPRDPR